MQELTIQTTPSLSNSNSPMKSSGSSINGFPEHDYVIVIDYNKSKHQQCVTSTVELIILLEQKGFGQFSVFVNGKLLILVKCGKRRLHKQYFKSKLNDWLKGVGGSDFDHTKELDTEIIRDLLPSHRLRLVYDVLTSTVDDGGVDILGDHTWSPFILDVFCRHDESFNGEWMNCWYRKWYLTTQDFTHISNYFGEEIGLYFAFLQYYFSWLALPSIISVFVHFYGPEYSASFSIATTLWGLAFIEFWARRQKDLSMYWGSHNCTNAEKVRSRFKPDAKIKDPVTGLMVKYYSPFKRFAKLLITIPVVAAMVTSLLVLIFILFTSSLILNQYYIGPFADYIKFAPTIIYTLCVPRLNSFYGNACRKLNEFENYQTDEENDTRLAQKLFVSSFLANFSSPLLYGLFFVPFGDKMADIVGKYINVQHKEIGPDLFRREISYFIFTGQVVNFLFETIVPYLMRNVTGFFKFGSHKHSHSVNISERAESSLKALERELDLPEYDINEDYSEMVTQFGYVMIFSSVYPIAAVAAFINNWIELRSDALKICVNFKRPIPRRAENIGTWLISLRFFTWFSVLTNVTWIFMLDREKKASFDEWPQLLLQILIWEHIFFLIAFLMNRTISLLSSWAQEESRRQDWNLKRKFLRLLGDDEDYDESITKSAENLGIDPHDPVCSRKSSIESIETSDLKRSTLMRKLESTIKI